MLFRSDGILLKENHVRAAGGVGEAVRRVHPWAVDVSSGTETDGRKDHARVRAFVEAVRAARGLAPLAAVDVVLEETDAALKRKDAVLRMARGALAKARQSAVENCEENGFSEAELPPCAFEVFDEAIAAIDAELSDGGNNDAR